MEITGKVALVTGGTRGIGAAVALALAKRGARVAIVGRNADLEAESVCQKIQALGRRAAMIVADVGMAGQAARCVTEAAERLGHPDILVHSAGGPVPGGLLEISPEDWYAAFDVHVHAVFHLCRAAIPAMRRKREGAVVLISSVAGLRGCRGITAYQAVKGAIPQLVRALAREFADDNIRINAVAPGIIRTRFHANMTEDIRKNNIENRIPLHREGSPEQVAALVLELVANDYITGETVAIDGGLTMRIA